MAVRRSRVPELIAALRNKSKKVRDPHLPRTFVRKKGKTPAEVLNTLAGL